MFDPFENRVSRDIRNQLSIDFLDLLEKGNRTEFDRRTTALKRQAPDADHIRYIETRLKIYQELYPKVIGKPPIEIGRCLWSHTLFFECHEWLEPLWLEATGSEKKAIQGIIRAAGAHVLDEAGRNTASRSSAQKASVLIQDHRTDIPRPFDADELLTDLERLIG